MKMTVKLTQIGNSKGIRIPSSVLKNIDADEVGEKFALNVKGNKIILEKEESDVIDELFKDFDLDNYYKKHDTPEMVDWGKPQGREIF